MAAPDADDPAPLGASEPSGGLDAIADPDDTGTDTFARYHYQAEAAFPSCLRCALVGDVVTITPERIEDLLIEEPKRWRFVQIKTRDAGYGPFTYADLLDPNGGALHSVIRTHRALADFDDGREIAYEIWLERGAKRSNDIEKLLRPYGQGADGPMVDQCATRLKVNPAVAGAMLARTLIRASLPPRELIRDRNIRDLQRYAPGVPAQVTEQVYDEVIALIEAAMRAELLANKWPECVLAPDTTDEQLRIRVAAKRLDAGALGPPLEPLAGGNGAVLQQITEPDQLAASELDRKLLAAGVGSGTRDMAKQLRANASRRVYEMSTGLESPEARMEDLDLRVLTRATAIAGTITADPPGPAVYSAVLDDVDVRRDSIDPDRLLTRDPMLLFGRLCELSDRCRFPWRP